MKFTEDELIELYEENQWIVHRAVRKYTSLRMMQTGEGYKEAKEEVEALANLSFFIHAKAFDPSKSEAKFSSYAYRGVQAYVLRNILRKSATIHPPSLSADITLKVRGVLGDLLNQEIGLDELARIASVRLKGKYSLEACKSAIRLIDTFHKPYVSFDRSARNEEGGERTIGEMIPSPPIEPERLDAIDMKKYRRFPRAHIFWMVRVLQGYNQVEIQEELGVTKYIVRAHLRNRLRVLMERFLDHKRINFKEEEARLTNYLVKHSRLTEEELDELFDEAYNDFVNGNY